MPALTAMLFAYFGLAWGSAQKISVTVDEFGHLPMGFHILKTGDFRYCDYHPPLVDMLLAIPLLGEEAPRLATLPPGAAGSPHDFWFNGYQFMHAHASEYHRLFMAGRGMSMLLGALLAVVAFAWARLLAPQRKAIAAPLAAGLCLFSPSLLAHARLATNDVGLALFMTVSLFTFHLFLRNPTRARGALAGAALGAALLSKGTAILLPPLFIAFAAAQAIRRPDRRRDLALGMIALVAVSWLAVNALFLFQGSFWRLGDASFQSRSFSSLKESLPGWLRIPLPWGYVRTFDQQSYDAEGGGYRVFLLGDISLKPRADYFVALLALKTPVPSLILGCVALAAGVWRRRPDAETTAILLGPAAAILALFSLFSAKQIGLRMIMPAEPLFWVWCSTVACSIDWGRGARAGLAGLVGASLACALAAYPYYLEYFNFLAGPTSRVHRVANDSNLEWGQDLIRLREFMQERRIPRIQLWQYGRVDPAIYGIDYIAPRERLYSGLLAVSVSRLELPYPLYDHGTLDWLPPVKGIVAELGEPVARVGRGMLIYNVPKFNGADSIPLKATQGPPLPGANPSGR